VAIAGLVYLSGCAGAPPVPASSSGRTVEYLNGRWFDGATFEPRTVYTVGDTLTMERPVRIDETIDLASGYVVPPFAEAHNHNIEGPWDVEARIRAYLRDDVFYVEITNSIREFTVQIADAGLTASGGHPVALYEGMVNQAARRRGLDPRLLPLVVARARAEGWRITAHVETPADFHHAVMAGVDEIAHLPPFEIEDNGRLSVGP
jgi:hypothetical protein